MAFSRQEYWSGLPFPSPVDHVLSELSTMTCPSWGPYVACLIVSLSWTRLWSMWSNWLVFCDCGFQSVCPLMENDKRLMDASWWERLTEGKTGSCSMCSAMLSKSLIQFSVDGWNCVPSLLFTWGQTVVEVMKIMATSLKRSYACTATLSGPSPAAGHRGPRPLLETPGHPQESPGQSPVGSLHLSPGSWCTQGSACALQVSISQCWVRPGSSAVGLTVTSSRRA